VGPEHSASVLLDIMNIGTAGVRNIAHSVRGTKRARSAVAIVDVYGLFI
jgi:hypothetical protein